MVYRANRGRLGRAPQPAAQPVTVPASVGGINSLDSIMGMPPQDCLYTYNMMPVEYGLRLRKGYREWATGCGAEDVHTILSYEAQSSAAAEDRLWAVTPEGIWDVTLFNTTVPVQDVTFTNQSPQAGYGVQCEFTNDAAKHYLFYADALNGLHQYEEGAGWSQPVGGINPGEWFYKDAGGTDLPFPVEDIAFVTVHKLRIWVILENSDDAWYLPLYSIAGELKKFVFGAKLVHGGNLMGLWTWTVDGGDGVDDYLLAVSRGGDLAMYRGNDPESADWTTTGTWFIGEVPESRRIVEAYGAEMYILSTYGITSLRDLLQGTVANELRNSPSAKVNRFMRADIESGKNFYEWAIEIHPADGFLQVITPEPTNTPYLQYNQNLATKAWGFWEGVPMKCGSTWNGEYFMGGKAGVVYIYDGVLDGTLVDSSGGEPVGFRLLTSYQANGAHANFKVPGFIRTIAVGAGTASINVKALFDYQVSDINLAPPTYIPPPASDNAWDSAVWDVASWDYDTVGAALPSGALGIGRTMAIAMVGQSSSRFNIVGWDVIYTQGGML